MKAVIFDFDGTIADTFPFVLDIANKLAPKYGYKRMTQEELELLREMSFKDIIRKYQVGPVKMLRMTMDAHKANYERLSETKVFSGLTEVLRELKDSGYHLAIISSNSSKNIQLILKREGLSDVFDGVYTSLNIFGKGAKLRKAIKKGGFLQSDTIYVGDEVRDCDAALEAGAIPVSVTWGYNTAKLLKSKNKLVADTPAKLLAIIKNHFK